MSKVETIDPRFTINEIVLRHPAALGPLAAHGLDTCCQANKTLAAAALAAGLNSDALIEEIMAVVEDAK